MVAALVVMVVRFCIEAPALATLHDNAVRIMMSHVDQQLRLARATAIGFVTAAFARGRSGRVLQNIGALRLGRCQQDHVELGHGENLFFSSVVTAKAVDCQRLHFRFRHLPQQCIAPLHD